MEACTRSLVWGRTLFGEFRTRETV